MHFASIYCLSWWTNWLALQCAGLIDAQIKVNHFHLPGNWHFLVRKFLGSGFRFPHIQHGMSPSLNFVKIHRPVWTEWWRSKQLKLTMWLRRLMQSYWQFTNNDSFFDESFNEIDDEWMAQWYSVLGVWIVIARLCLTPGWHTADWQLQASYLHCCASVTKQHNFVPVQNDGK